MDSEEVVTLKEILKEIKTANKNFEILNKHVERMEREMGGMKCNVDSVQSMLSRSYSFH